MRGRLWIAITLGAFSSLGVVGCASAPAERSPFHSDSLGAAITAEPTSTDESTVWPPVVEKPRPRLSALLFRRNRRGMQPAAPITESVAEERPTGGTLARFFPGLSAKPEGDPIRVAKARRSTEGDQVGTDPDMIERAKVEAANEAVAAPEPAKDEPPILSVGLPMRAHPSVPSPVLPPSNSAAVARVDEPAPAPPVVNDPKPETLVSHEATAKSDRSNATPGPVALNVHRDSTGETAAPAPKPASKPILEPTPEAKPTTESKPANEPKLSAPVEPVADLAPPTESQPLTGPKPATESQPSAELSPVKEPQAAVETHQPLIPVSASDKAPSIDLPPVPTSAPELEVQPSAGTPETPQPKPIPPVVAPAIAPSNEDAKAQKEHTEPTRPGAIDLPEPAFPTTYHSESLRNVIKDVDPKAGASAPPEPRRTLFPRLSRLFAPKGAEVPPKDLQVRPTSGESDTEDWAGAQDSVEPLALKVAKRWNLFNRIPTGRVDKSTKR